MVGRRCYRLQRRGARVVELLLLEKGAQNHNNS